MNNLQQLQYRDYDSTEIRDMTKYNKIDAVKSLSTQHSPINIAEKLLRGIQDPKLYVKQHKMEFTFRQSLSYQPSQSQMNQTDAVSVIETSNAEEMNQTQQSQQSQASQGSRRKFQMKSRVSQKSQQQLPTQSQVSQQQIQSQLQSNKSQITRICLQFKEVPKFEYGLVIKVDEQTNQLDFKACQDKQIVWDNVIQVGVLWSDMHVIVIQQSDKKIQSNVCQVTLNVDSIQQQFNQDIQLKHMKQVQDASISIEF